MHALVELGDYAMDLSMKFGGIWAGLLGVAACGGVDAVPASGAAGMTATQAGSGGSAGSSAGSIDSAQGGTTAAAGESAGGMANAGVAGSASGGGCRSDQPFGMPHALAELNTDERELGARLTSDELTIVYACTPENSPGMGFTQICLAKRKKRSDPFAAPKIVTDSLGDVPWISDDTLTLLFEHRQGGESVYLAQREDPAAVFDVMSIVLEPQNHGDPYVVGGQNGHIYASGAAGLEMAPLKEWQASEPGVILGDSGAVRPVPSQDELTLYYGKKVMSETARQVEIWVTQRASAQEPFDDGAAVSVLNTADYNYPSWISPDQCRLYFDIGSTASRDLYVVERE
jgi:hypothetical protein